jgi:hypothetical protein
MKSVVGITRVSKFLNAVLLPNDQIFTLDLFVFALSGYDDLAFLQSSVHEVWTRKQSSTQETRLRYTGTDCFETLPLPIHKGMLSEVGERYTDLRSAILSERGVGLTKLYNSFHSEVDRHPRIQELRDLHREIDTAVASAYGWGDLDLKHGFYAVPYLPENDRVRFTVSEPARLDILRRLGELNRQRYNAEAAGGSQASAARRRRGRAKPAVTTQGALDLTTSPTEATAVAVPAKTTAAPRTTR